ncbi:hypothetical protein SAMN05660284_01890 [Formivibrio citricus]|uniref:AB hydrolase-1 domain-containing protein n=2 Tax=Formivibrio citricus TaxID=83765 RepID=A0A1I5AG71_9NEIS|nr:hypothetical protein SAMN05660284_01890 [Formivibrio citricus]
MALILMLTYLALCGIMYWTQRSFLYFPQPATGSSGPERILDLRVDDVRVRVSVRNREGADALVYFGGNAEDVTRSLDDYAQAFPDHAIYMLHYRGYGGSTGAPSEAALHRDAKVLLDLVKSRHSRVMLVGRSLGSGVAVRLAAENPVERLVLITPYDSIVNVGREQFPWLPVGWLLKDRFESVRWAPAVKARTLILMAERDEIIAAERTRALHRTFASGVASLEVVPGADHNSIMGSTGVFGRMR